MSNCSKLLDEPLSQHAGSGSGNYRGLLLAIRPAGPVRGHTNNPYIGPG